MIGDILEFPADDLGALEFIVGTFQKFFDRSRGGGIVEADLAVACFAALHADEPDRSPQSPASAAAQADAARESRRHDRVQIGRAHLFAPARPRS